MGAGGGIWANERDELRRPGFNGGGGGKPLEAGATRTTAGGTTAAGMSALTALTNLTDLLLTAGSAFGDSFTAGLDAALTLISDLGTDLGTDLTIEMGTDLPTGLAVDLLGRTLAAVDFLMGADRAEESAADFAEDFAGGLAEGFAGFFEASGAPALALTSTFTTGLTVELALTMDFPDVALPTLTA